VIDTDGSVILNMMWWLLMLMRVGSHGNGNGNGDGCVD
jgi:hypothetical protein